MNRSACPRCGAASLQPGASKCPACRAWIAAPPPQPLGVGALWATAAGLILAGALLGALAARLAVAPLAPLEPAPAAPPAGVPPAPAAASAAAPAAAPASASASAPSAASASASASAPASAPAPASASASAAAPASASAPASAVAPAGPAAEARWAEPRPFRVGAAPIDVAVSDDGATVFVLCQDGTVRALSAETGREERRLALPGRPTGIRLLGGRYLAGLGAANAFPVVDVATWTAAKLDLGGSAIDAVAPPGGGAVIAASADAQRVARFAPPAPGKPPAAWRRDGQLPLPRPPARLHAAAGDPDLLAILAPAARPGEPGSIHLLDPGATPFGAARVVFQVALDPDAQPLPEPGGVAVVDRGGSQRLRVTPSDPIEVAPIAATPRGGVIGVFRLLERYLVLVDAVGTATVVTEPGGVAVATLALGAAPSDAALTPDGLAVLVALGGGPRGRGAETVVLSGDPPAISARLATGAGSQAVSIGGAGRRAAVAAFWPRTVAVIDRR